MRSGSDALSVTGISLWPSEEVPVMVVMVFLLFSDSDNVSTSSSLCSKLVWEATPDAAFASVTRQCHVSG